MLHKILKNYYFSRVNIIMPTINFFLASGKYTNLASAMQAYNIENPQNPAADEHDFAKKATLEALQAYLTRYRNSRIAAVSDQIAVCSNEQWNQVTGILLGP